MVDRSCPTLQGQQLPIRWTAPACVGKEGRTAAAQPAQPQNPFPLPKVLQQREKGEHQRRGRLCLWPVLPISPPHRSAPGCNAAIASSHWRKEP